MQWTLSTTFCWLHASQWEKVVRSAKFRNTICSVFWQLSNCWYVLLQPLDLFCIFMAFAYYFRTSCLFSDLFDHKSIGIFSLLNDECKLRKPSVENFGSNLKNSWGTQKMSPIKWINPRKKSEDTFLISHFTSDVQYATVCFSFKFWKANDAS